MEQNVNDQCVFPIEPVFWFLKYTTYPPNPHSSQAKAYMQYWPDYAFIITMAYKNDLKRKNAQTIVTHVSR
jgi:hypothetical protein